MPVKKRSESTENLNCLVLKVKKYIYLNKKNILKNSIDKLELLSSLIKHQD
jgi:hypothetical protein